MIREHSDVTVAPTKPGPLPGVGSDARHQPGACQGVGEVLARVGDKWSVLTVMTLGNGPRRFNEIKRSIGAVSQRMLTLTLRGLERDGLVTRTVFPTIPPRVDYELTDLGVSLWKPVEALGLWAQQNQVAMEAARRRFDQRTGRVTQQPATSRSAVADLRAFDVESTRSATPR